MTNVDYRSADTRDSYVLCEVAGGAYAIASDAIEQLDMLGTVTAVPNAPAFVEGVISVRGRVIPAVNLRARFGFPRIATDARTRVVVARDGSRAVGLIVDSAREFARIPEESVQAPPEALTDESSAYFRGIAHLGERLVLVLDVPELLRRTDTPAPAALAGLANAIAGTLPASL